MYIPHYHKNENLEEVKEFLKANSFGILLNQNNGKIWGSHIPLELEVDPNGEEVIYGHISKANFQLKDYTQGKEEVLLIFNGPHSYVSSSWYNHENVPTWNYIAVHIYGSLEVIDSEELKYSLDKLINKYEATMENPIHLDSLSEITMKQMKGIIGFKIYINEIQAAYKLSQNRDDEDYHNIVEELIKSDNNLDKETSKIMNSKR